MNKRKQAGMSAYVLVLLLAVSGFLLKCAFAVVPLYSENYYIAAALRSLAENHPTDLAKITKAQAKRELSKIYMLNNVRSEGAQALVVDKSKEATLIIVEYEARVPIIGNIDAVLSFKNVLDSSSPDECCSVKEE